MALALALASVMDVHAYPNKLYLYSWRVWLCLSNSSDGPGNLSSVQAPSSTKASSRSMAALEGEQDGLTS